MTSRDPAEVEQLPRFGPLRAEPPAAALDWLTGAEPGTAWRADRFGDGAGYPNGGIWRLEADRRRESGPAAVWVKRTGAAYLGSFQVWRLRADPSDPQWWGREAAFYRSDLAAEGWPGDVRPPRCVVDDHDGCLDLWIEEIRDVPASLETCRRAVAGLAHWQAARAEADHPWLSDGWIATHVKRHALDNDRTLAHPAWPAAIDRGLDPALRELVAARVTDPAEITSHLAEFPRALTNHDFHTANLGTVGERVAIIDWAYVGWGPVGHDIGHLALSFEQGDAAETWRVLEAVYLDALEAVGWVGDLGQVRRSMIISNRLRLGWWIDMLLDNADRLSPEALAAHSRRMLFLHHLR